MEATSTRQATAAAAAETMPACPHCRSAMVVRSQWSGGRVTGLYWGCVRAPGCEGTRRIKAPDAIHPVAHDASAQAIFDWQTSRAGGSTAYRHDVAPLPTATAGLRGLLGKVLNRPSAGELEMAELEEAPNYDAVGYFDGLLEHGFVVLEDRALPAARVHIDNVVIGPSGVFVVERKAWPGQLVTTNETIFLDGRERPAAIVDVSRATQAFEQTLAHELKPLGATVHSALLFERAVNKSFQGVVGKVAVGGTRGLPKVIRGREEPVLGPETIVRLAVAADRLLD